MKVISNNEKGLRFMVCHEYLDDNCNDARRVIANTDSLEEAENKLADFMVNVGVEDGDVVRVYEWDGSRYNQVGAWH